MSIRLFQSRQQLLNEENDEAPDGFVWIVGSDAGFR